MQTTIDPTLDLASDPTSEKIAHLQSHLEGLVAYQLHLFSFVPDDKLAWTPAPTARTPLALVVHCGQINRFFAHILTGSLPEPLPAPDTFFQDLRAAGETFTTRESAIALVRETTTELCKALDTVTTANLDTPRDSPFGPLPAAFWLDQTRDHLTYHNGQLAYLQTLWGDLDNHLG